MLVVNAKPRPIYPWEKSGTHCIGGWVGLRASLDGCGKSRLPRDSIPGPSSLWLVAIPTEPFRPKLRLDQCEFKEDKNTRPIPVASRSKLWACSSSLAAIAGANSAGAWIFFSCECCKISGRGLYDGPIPMPEESYRPCCFSV